MDTIALILAGGNGTRFWPLSRKTNPKQVLALKGSRSLLQETSRRILPLFAAGNQWVVTNDDLYQKVKSQMEEMFAVDYGTACKMEFLKEPEAKSTAPAIIWSAFRCRRKYGSYAVIAVFPSDHAVLGEKAFLESLKKAVEKAEEGFIITFGIVPSYPETGYGYIKVSEEASNDNSIYKVERFTEKPDLQTAENFLEERGYLWNSGVYVFQAGVFLEEAAKYCPDIYNSFSEIDPFDDWEVQKAFKAVDAVSIDYAVMEHTKKAYVIQVDMEWSDLGSWKSLYGISEKDIDGNVIEGGHIAIDTKGSYIYGKERLIASIGLSNIAIIDTRDALLVVPLDQTNRIREVVERLKEENSRLYKE